jgi:hypothetical protein
LSLPPEPSCVSDQPLAVPLSGRSAPAQGWPALLARRGLCCGCNHFRREMKQASNESPLSMTPINNALRSCWYSSSAYFTAGLAGNLWRPCEGSIGRGPEKRGADLSPRRQRNRSASPAGDSALRSWLQRRSKGLSIRTHARRTCSTEAPTD